MRYIFTLGMLLFSTMEVNARDLTFVVGGEISCLGKSNHHVILGQTYNHREYTLYSVFEKVRTGSWIEPSRIAEITENEFYDPIIYVFPTKTYADIEIALKSDKPLIGNVTASKLNWFCSQREQR
jgi:hypothetical protein